MILGGLLGFLFSFGPTAYGLRLDGTIVRLILAVLAMFLGFLILVYSGFTHYRAADRSLGGGLVLVILGIVTGVVWGGWILVAAGSLLTILAGLALMFLVLFPESMRRVSISE